MNKKTVMIVISVIIVLFVLWYFQNLIVEKFEAVDTPDEIFAQKILKFLKNPNTYVGYVDFLIENKNTSSKLTEKSTYDYFINKLSTDSLQVSDILPYIIAKPFSEY